MNTCEFCNKNFKTIITLTTHKKTSKKCLSLRNKTPIVIHKCDHCDFKTNIKNALKIHQLTCDKTKVNKEIKKYLEENNLLKQQHLQENNLLKQQHLQEKETQSVSEGKKDSTILKLNKDIVEYKNQLTEYKEQLNDLIKTLALKPNITNKNVHNNNTTNNKLTNNNIHLSMINLDPTYVKEKVENNFTLEYLNNGQKGLAKFTKDHILQEEDGKTKYICTDASRNFFKYKDTNGLVKKDIRASKLTEAIKDPIICKSQILFSTEQDKLMAMANNRNSTETESDSYYLQLGLLAKSFFEMKKVGQDNTNFLNELSLLCNR
jgi:hypothetical protein